MAVVAAFMLSALLVFVLLLPRGLRRRRKGDEELELYYEPPKVSPWVFLVLWGLVLIPLGFAAYLLWLGWAPVGESGALLHRPFRLSPAPPPFRAAAGKPVVSFPLFTGAVAVLALLAALGSLGLALWIFFGDRLARWWHGPLSFGRGTERLGQAVEESLDDLRREPDARRAIIRCYRRFEQVLARSGVPRAPWETPVEFMRAALGRLPLPDAAVGTLTGLFEVSRFSHHPLDVTEREAAWESLLEIKAALERSEAHGSAA
jgi:hypothetical protein